MVRRFCKILFSLLVLSSNLIIAQDSLAKPRSPKIIGSRPEWIPASQELYAPYWTLEPGWNTDLEVRNNVPWHDLTMTPVLRSSDGSEVALASVHLKPEQIVSINLRNALASIKPELFGKTDSYGSVVFRFEGTSAQNGFAAAVIRREGHPIDFHFDAEDVGSKQFEGIWWMPSESATAYLILSNPNKTAVTGKLVLSDASGGTVKRFPLTIGPGQTIRTDLRESLGNPTTGAFGGVSVSADVTGTLSATEIVFDEVSGLSSTLKMFDRQTIAEADKSENRTLRAPMMAFTHPDPGLGLPEGTSLEPKVFLRNASAAPVVLSPNVNWHVDAKFGSSPLPQIKLAPVQMILLNLADLQKSRKIPGDINWGTVTLGFAGRSADIIAVAMSYDKDNRYGLQTPFSEIMNHLFKGSMWHVDPLHNTMITMGNGGSEPTKGQVTLFYNEGRDTYRVEQTLNPGEQMWLNLGNIIHNQIPDSDGKVLPPGAMSGSYELRDIGHPIIGLLYEGKLIVDKTFGHASYGCAHCCGYSRGTLWRLLSTDRLE